MKLIKISVENHQRLTKLKASLMAANGKNHTYDDAIEFLLDRWEANESS